MYRYALGCALACALTATATLGAQTPPQSPATQPANPQTTTNPQTADTPRMPNVQDQAGTMVTVEGCLRREADVPGRQPNVAERAGLGEDYILTDTKMVKGSAPTMARRTGEPDRVGTSGTSALMAMYEIEGIDDDKLQQHVGQRVQIEGTFRHADRAGVAREPGANRDTTGAGGTAASARADDDLVELRGTTIRRVAGECPASPAK